MSAKNISTFVALSVCAVAAHAAIYPIPSATPATSGACPDYLKGVTENQQRINELGQQNAQIQLLQAQARMVQMYVACRQAGGGQSCGDPPQMFLSQGKTTDYDCVEYQMKQPVTGWPKPTDGQRLAAALNYSTR